MKKFVLWGANALLFATLTLGLAACHDDDVNKTEIIEPPVVEVTTYSVSGLITSISGQEIAGATVTLSGAGVSKTATTDADGLYQFEDLDAGSYELTASATSKISKSGTVTVVSGDVHTFTWSAQLSSEESVVDVEVQEDGSVEGEVQAEALEDNEQAEIVVEVSAPAEAVVVETSGDDNDGSAQSEPIVISVSPVYTEDEVSTRAMVAATRAGVNKLITGTRLACSNPNAKIADGKSIDLKFNVDASTVSNVKAYRYDEATDQWTEVSYTTEGSDVTIPATQFTVYALFCPITFTLSSSSQSITMNPSLWDNFYGSKALEAGESTYTYNVGTSITTKANSVFVALLKEALAREYGATAKQATGTYPVNTTVPVGTRIELTGSQKVNTVTAACGNGSISGTQYGDVTVKVKSTSRSHTGGGN
jgi:hypothetical protein